MLDFRPVLYIIGILLTTLAAAMCAPLVAGPGGPSGLAGICCLRVDRLYWRYPVVDDNGAAVAAFCPSGLFSNHDQLARNDVFCSPAACFRQPGTGFHRRVFRGDVGSYHYGSTVITSLDMTPSGILPWRAILQWLGGIGIIVMSIAILPMLKIGGNQLFQTELRQLEKVLLVAQIASGSGSSISPSRSRAPRCCGFRLRGFDAIAVLRRRLRRAGFRPGWTIGALLNPGAEVIITCFMLLGALPFVLYLQALRGKPLLLWRMFLRCSLVFSSSLSSCCRSPPLHHINNGHQPRPRASRSRLQRRRS